MQLFLFSFFFSHPHLPFLEVKQLFEYLNDYKSRLTILIQRVVIWVSVLISEKGSRRQLEKFCLAVVIIAAIGLIIGLIAYLASKQSLNFHVSIWMDLAMNPPPPKPVTLINSNSEIFLIFKIKHLSSSQKNNPCML